MGTNKEVFNTELYAIREGPRIALKGGHTGRGGVSQETTTKWRKIYILEDLRAAIARLQNTATALCQWRARQLITIAQQLE